MKTGKRVTLVLAIVLCVGELAWFARYTLEAINFDGIAYTGIAATIKAGKFRESIDAFRSPLISWFIALVPRLPVLPAGKIITVASFLLTAVLLYLWAFELWHSKEVAATAVLLLVLARGITFFAVALVTPDFLLAALVLAYFIALLKYLRSGSHLWWGAGLIHGIAFLAKAIALPWLTVCALTAIVVSMGHWKSKIKKFLSAMAIPVAIAGIWACVLHSKYGVYTTGSQFKTNLFQWTLRGAVPLPRSNYALLRDLSPNISHYMVDDPMPPGAWQWSYHPANSLLIRKIFSSESGNIPIALKELLMLMTPGIPLAVFVLLPILWASSDMRVESALAITVVVGSVALVLAYSMLAIDARYFFPVIPLWFAIGSKFLWPDPEFEHQRLRWLCVGLIVCGTMFSLTYWASPFRVQRRDWQVSSRSAGTMLRLHQVETVVSIGSGPFPEHGVGWESGYLSCYFGNARLIASLDSIPRILDGLQRDMAQASPDAVLLWDMDNQERDFVHQVLAIRYGNEEKIMDPELGEVGLVLYRRTP